MSTPLYREITRLLNDRNGFRRFPEASTSLLFDKFADLLPNNTPNGAENDRKHGFLKAIAVHSRNRHGTAYLQEYIDRQVRLVSARKGKVFRAKSDWRFVSGVGGAHPTETGFVWHRTLSVPYLPGSSVKGMMRAMARLQDGGSGGKNEERVYELFGGPKPEKDANGERKVKDYGAGRLVVFDTLPTAIPALEPDIINVHYQQYYTSGTVAPGDYMDPVPVYFLTVASGAEFQFGLAPMDRGTKQDLDEGTKLLQDALHMLGAGAKTSAGYGRFRGFKMVGEPGARMEVDRAQ